MSRNINVTDDTRKNLTIAQQQHLAEQCDLCGVHVPDGEGHYRDDDDRICEDCDDKATKEEA